MSNNGPKTEPSNEDKGSACVRGLPGPAGPAGPQVGPRLFTILCYLRINNVVSNITNRQFQYTSRTKTQGHTNKGFQLHLRQFGQIPDCLSFHVWGPPIDLRCQDLVQQQRIAPHLPSNLRVPVREWGDFSGPGNTAAH